MQKIVHVSADFPDIFVAEKTPVIRALIDGTRDEFDHHVLSLNRFSPSLASFARDILSNGLRPRLSVETETFEYGTALRYSAPGKGIFHKTLLHQLGDWMAQYLRATGVPQLLVGHKLTVEGIAVRHAAQQLGIPFVICVQGNTDEKILRIRPDLRNEFGRVFHGASMLFPFTPWALEAFETRLGKRKGPVRMLPCATDLDQQLAPDPSGKQVISAFHLKNHAGKNLAGLAKAMRILHKQGFSHSLSILGGGSPEDQSACEAICAGQSNISFAGAKDRASVRHQMNQSGVFVLPSLRESFGLVFVEALFAGLPIIYPKGAAVDGYFEDLPFARAVDARHPAQIADAIQEMHEKRVELKALLQEWQGSDHAVQFTRRAIMQQFSEGLRQAAAENQA